MKQKILAIIALTFLVTSCGDKFISSELDRIVISKDYSIEDKRTLIETEYAIDTPQNSLLYPGERFFIYFKVNGLEQASYGKLNTFLQYTIYNPEGQIFFESTGYTPQRNFTIDKNGVTSIDGGMWREFSIDDIPGEYRIEAIINDYVTEKNYKLETTITLVEGSKVTDVMFETMDELKGWADSYSVEFSSYKLSSAVDFYLREGNLVDYAYWLGLFSEIHRYYPTSTHNLITILNGLEDPSKRLFLIDILFYSGGPNVLISSMDALTTEEFNFVNENRNSTLPLQFVKLELDGYTIKPIDAGKLNIGKYKASGFFADLTTFLQLYTLGEYDNELIEWADEVLEDLYKTDPHTMGYLSTLAPIAHKVEWISEDLEDELLLITGLSPVE